MNRRAFVTGLGVVLAAAMAVGAQQAEKVYRVGYLSGISDTGAPHPSDAFRQSMRALGWLEGQNLVIEYRSAGLVGSLAHPGGNITGLTTLSADLSGKQFELLKALVSHLTRVAILSNPTNPWHPTALQGIAMVNEASSPGDGIDKRDG
jgi:putative tryptophan/tyrosine transport system substrate-binding protein